MTRHNDIKKEQLRLLKHGYKGRLKALKEYYSNKGLSIIGLNALEESGYLYHKGLVQSLAKELSTDDSKTVIIDAFSTVLNEAQDIKYLLDSNPSIADLKNLRMYSKIRLLEEQLEQMKMPKFLGKFGYINGILNPISQRDKNIKLTSTLKESTEPIIIYASGLDDLMNELNSDPFKFDDDYISNISEYKYTLQKINNKDAIKKVVGNIEKSFQNILLYNNNISLFAIGANTHVVCYSDNVRKFRDVIKEYDHELRFLCDAYGFDYIPSYGNLTNEILERLYTKKIWGVQNGGSSNLSSGKITNKDGLFNALCALKRELQPVDKIEEPEFVKNQKKMVLRRKIDVVEKTLMKNI